jgi:hypothetical protein
MSIVNTKCEIHAETTLQGRKIIGNSVVWRRNKSFFPVILCTISTVHGCLDQDNSELQDLGDTTRVMELMGCNKNKSTIILYMAHWIEIRFFTDCL